MESAAESWNITHKNKQRIMGPAWVACFNSKISIKTNTICWYSHLLSHMKVINKVQCPLRPSLNTETKTQICVITAMWYNTLFEHTPTIFCFSWLNKKSAGSQMYLKKTFFFPCTKAIHLPFPLLYFSQAAFIPNKIVNTIFSNTLKYIITQIAMWYNTLFKQKKQNKKVWTIWIGIHAD